MDRRGVLTGIAEPGPFHCIACKTYVIGTASGHCPRCGFVPPVALALPAPRARLEVGVPAMVLLACVAVAFVLLVR